VPETTAAVVSSSHRLAFGKLLAQLALPEVEDERLLSPAQSRGRKAAQTRWAKSSRKSVSYGTA